jgi:hypothetical protein
MLRLPRRTTHFAGVVFVALSAVTAKAATPAEGIGTKPGPVLAIAGLGKGTAPLDGPWQFHLGDDPAYALPQTADSSGANGWEPLGPDQPWGAQGHRSYTGYAWYRKHLSITPSPGASPEFYLLFNRVDDVYAVYWNGQLVGHYGSFPPDPTYPYARSPQIVHLGPARDGVLAIRVWKAPLDSFDSGLQGGLNAVPSVGSLEAVKADKTALDYTWLRGRQ